MDLSAAELEVWRQFHNSYGFPQERAEWGRAISAAYVGAVWGGKAKPAELVPKIGGQARPKFNRAAIIAWFEGRAKAKPKQKDG